MLVCLVIAVSDGDSLTVRCGGPGHYQQHHVRIHAIDAPERWQGFSQAARDSLAGLCLEKVARIQRMDTDQYGRIIGQVECRSQDAAAHQVRRGMAWVYAHYAGKRADLLALEASAQASHTGLWADSHPIAPWLWRRR